MKYYQENDKVILKNFDSFNIEETFECGQCFRFEKKADGEYVIIAFSKVLTIKQTEDYIEFYPTDILEFENIWIKYFDLNRDYTKIKNTLSQKDEVLKKAITFAEGIRILQQDPWECLISFIISQNNRIPMIKQVIKNISEKYGTYVSENFLFPTFEQIQNATEDELISCKTGFRAKYILDAINHIKNGNIDFEMLKQADFQKAKAKLMEIKGVGDKVSDCVLLFSLNKKSAFPIDVWVKRVMEYFYFDGENANIKDIHKLAIEKFGDYAGFAQQYLFHYARQLKIGEKQGSKNENKSK